LFFSTPLRNDDPQFAIFHGVETIKVLSKAAETAAVSDPRQHGLTEQMKRERPG
jgi:hypothetical protein